MRFTVFGDKGLAKSWLLSWQKVEVGRELLGFPATAGTDTAGETGLLTSMVRSHVMLQNGWYKVSPE